MKLTAIYCRVKIYVSFIDTYITKSIIPKRGNITYIDTELLRGGDTYGYILQIKLDIDEYKLHKNNLSKYVEAKAKNHKLYTEKLEYCINEYGKGRNYKVESCFDEHDPNSIAHEYINHIGNKVLREYYD